MSLVVTGRVVTFDAERPVLDDGAVYVDADGLIEAVKDRGDPAPPGYDAAPHVRAGGVVYPGLIDLHNHIAYNCLPLWSPPGRTEPYTSRAQWPRDPSYKGDIHDPTATLGALAGKALLKYVETKAVVGGVTAIQGSAKTAHPYEGWLVRNVEDETFRTKKRTVFQSVRTLATAEDFESAHRHLQDGQAFIYHLSEGTDPKLWREFEDLREHDCLGPHLGAIHCTALDEPQYGEWRPKGGSVIWSPFSNLWLYRDTTDVPAARAAGLTVCLGADWSPSGSKSLLGELKVADLWSRTHLDGALGAEDLCRMVTCNPADALGWADRIGRLRPGLHGDVTVLDERDPDPYRNLVVATEAHVRFVAVNGEPFYGLPSLLRAGGATHAEPIRVGGHERAIVLVYPGIPDADMTWKQVLDALEAARADPHAAHARLTAARESGEEPVIVLPDKPWEPAEAPAAAPPTTEIPPLDTLAADAAYFRAIEQAPLHGGLLDGLRDYYR
ncbi:MAG TPA: amidohydrolase family protein [Solirubrobacteraceae bacterium]|nr:amidohydrolase family protein [Solirubrobacteraceae bacterium]